MRWSGHFLLVLMMVSAGCAPQQRPDAGASSALSIVGARAPGGATLELAIRDGVLHEGPVVGGRVLDMQGAFIVPAVVDSHVHLAFRGADERLVKAGVGAAVDLAAPLDQLLTIEGLEAVHAGPMIAAPGGYPTQSWGRGGYGAECATADDVATAIAAAAAAGARVVKLSLGHAPELSAAQLARAVEEAQGRGIKVAVHALSDDAAARAATLGADVLAHTPTEPLSPATVAAWSGRAVISTLAAFGASPAAVDNLRRLHDAGATVLYGTDLGNSRPMGIQREEIAALAAAGLSPEAIVAAMTSAPSVFWGVSTGAMVVGRPARLLVLDVDPLLDPTALAQPRLVILGGEVIDAVAPPL
jgi:imidazolonepropionase-like amidohydrolase